MTLPPRGRLMGSNARAYAASQITQISAKVARARRRRQGEKRVTYGGDYRPSIPRSHAVIEWNEDRGPAPLVFDILVFSRLEGRSPLHGPNRLYQVGANDSWLSEPRWTPEGIYAFWADRGFASTAVHLDALLALARIEGCEWARVMASALAVATVSANDA